MDAEWRCEKLAVLLEKVDRGRVNGLGLDFYDINFELQILDVGGQIMGQFMGGLRLHYLMGVRRFYWHTDSCTCSHKHTTHST